MEEEAIKLLAEVDKILQLGEKGLARESEAQGAEKRLKDFLQNNIDFDSELGREYEKWSKVTQWYDMPRDGFATRSHIAPIQVMRGFLTRLMDTRDIKTQPDQQYIRTGEVYTGRRVLRDILSRAKNKIDIQDNYLDQEVFAILQPYFENNANLEVRLLTGENISNAFKSDIVLFSKQFGRVSVKTHNQAHGRFVILDNNEIFSVGHSLKDIGKKADAISKIEDSEANKKALEDFETWWSAGNKVIQF